MRILSVDNAYTAGWSVVDGERLLEHGGVDARDPLRVNQLVGDLVARWGLDLAVIEDAYVAHGDKANVATTKTLCRLIGRWEMALALRAVPFEIMMADTWQRDILSGLAIVTGSKRAQRKIAAVRWVRATYGVTVSQDEADAIALATHVSRRESFKARVRGALSRPRSRSAEVPPARPGTGRSRPDP